MLRHLSMIATSTSLDSPLTCNLSPCPPEAGRMGEILREGNEPYAEEDADFLFIFDRHKCPGKPAGLQFGEALIRF